MRASRTRRPGGRLLAAIVVSFFAGVLVDAWLRTYGPPLPVSDVASASNTAEGRTKDGIVSAAPPPRALPTTAPAPSARVNAPVATTGNASRPKLRVPIDGANVDSWKGGFDERRGGGSRGHEAVDILSPRNTPVHAVEDGSIAKIFESKQGGHTVYQFSADGRLVYYYAHLQRYADGLQDGQRVTKGQLIGYVGTSGNAPPNTPHLHFAVFQLDADRRWWQGTAIDPYLVFHE
jgi:murein DD-endopeptidase MepM/ murein hydrolase activator NlpD